MNFKKQSIAFLVLCACFLAVTSCSTDSDDMKTSNDNPDMPFTPTTLSMDHFNYMQHVSLALISVNDSESLNEYFSKTFAYADEFINYDKTTTRGVVGASLSLTRFCKAITKMSNSTASYACQIIESKGISHEDAFNAVKRLYPNDTAESWWAKYSTGQIQSFQTYSELQLSFPFEFEKTRQEIMAGLGAECIQHAVAIVSASEPAPFSEYGTLANDLINAHSSSATPADLAEQYLKAASRFLVKNDDYGMTQDALDEIISQAKALLSAEPVDPDFTLTDRYLTKQTCWYENITDNSNNIIGQRKLVFSTSSGGKHQGDIYCEYNDSTRNTYSGFAWIVDDAGQLWFKVDGETDKSVWQVIKVYDNDTEKIKIVLRKCYTVETMTLSNYSTWDRQVFGQLTFVDRTSSYSFDFDPWGIEWPVTVHARSFNDVWSDQTIQNSLALTSIDFIYDSFSGKGLETLSVEKGKINADNGEICMTCTFDSISNSGSGTFTFKSTKSKTTKSMEDINKDLDIREGDLRLTFTQSITASGKVQISYNKSKNLYVLKFESAQGTYRSSGEAANHAIWDIPANNMYLDGSVQYDHEGTVSISRTLYYK